MKNRGFTLLEILIAITFMAALLITLFRSMGSVQLASKKIINKREAEKQIYLLHNYFTLLFKNMSDEKVSDNIKSKPLFQGDDKEMTFISTAPIIFPFRVPHLIKLRMNEDVLEYAEARYSGGTIDDMEEFEDEDYYQLLSGINGITLEYRMYDKRNKKSVWKEELDTFSDKPLPNQVSMIFIYGNKEYDFLFRGFLNEGGR